MARPRQCRWVRGEPQADFFKPRGIPMRDLSSVDLTVEELEALRLADLEGLYHEAAAESMGISRPTFSRVLTSARWKVADALINAKALKIKGGSYALEEGRKGRLHRRRRGWGPHGPPWAGPPTG